MQVETERFRDDEVPSAASVRVYICTDGGCGHPHLILFDDDGRPFAQAVMPDGVIADLVGCRLKTT
jgi:hypothetical protein